MAGFQVSINGRFWVSAEAPGRISDPDVLLVDRHFLEDDFYETYRVDDPTKLLVALGDSFTQSFPVSQEDSYPSVLQRTLSDAGWNVRVMNAGIGDTGSDQQLRIFEKYILPRVDPDIVVWQFYTNDTYDNVIKPLFVIEGALTLTPIDARNNWLYRRQRFVERVPLPSIIKRYSHIFHLLLRRYELDRRSQVPPDTDANDWGRRKVGLAVARMAELAEQFDFDIWYALAQPQALYQDDLEVGASGYNDAVEYPKLLAILGEQPGFIHTQFDPTSSEYTEPHVDLYADGTRDPSLPGSRHFNEAGYRLFARSVADGILEQRAFTRPTMAAIPNPVPAGPSWGVTTLTWDAGNVQQAEVYVSMNGEPEQLFSQRTRGYQLVEWIGSDAIYDFRLYAGADRIALLASTRVTRIGASPPFDDVGPASPQTGEPQLVASPNPVPAGDGWGTTMITWTTGDGGEGAVYVSTDGAPEQLFSRDPAGRQDAPWIGQDAVYTFRLYAGASRETLLAETTVSRAP